MGLDIKKNKKGEYSLKCSMSDESLHKGKKWVSEDEAKKILIERASRRFVREAIEIEMTFPNGYQVNEKTYYDKSLPNFGEWILKVLKDNNYTPIKEKFIALKKRLKITWEL